MKLGTPRHVAVLASLALLMSGQLCMLTTCVPRLHQLRSAAHACCRATPASSTSAPSQQAQGAMPCDIMLHGADAPVIASATPLSPLAALVIEAAAMLAPPACVVAAEFARSGSGPPHGWLSPAPAGLRAPPQG